ncbi:MAG: acetyl-CoA carboxylase biotin carboxyl carrier protein [Cyclobacteriaceae bacterium]|nr:acetyl-CoA carboxylase biotin carboxyl carrier protein [Cyclobacteriaceae bacterium]
MKTKEIRDLIDFISKSGLNEVNIETEELKLSIKRNQDVSLPGVVAQAPAMQPASITPTSSPAVQVEQVAASQPSDRYVEIKAPMIGTFYRSSNPDAEAFVSVGDKVEKGQTICIIEAMKLFNEIEADVSGTVVKILVDNATPVEYDHPLFLIDPS